MKLLRFCERFGYYRGSFIFMQLARANHSSKILFLKAPDIKYPIRIRGNSSDIPTFEQVLIDDEYDIPFSQPKVVIDGGANIGLFTILMKNKYPDATFICIEPDPENFLALKDNLSFYDNIHYENCGLWDKDTKLKVYDKYDYGKWGMVVEEDINEGNISAISISTLMKKYYIEYIDILKLDIETSEKQIFSNNFEEWLPKVKYIIIELHDWMDEGCSKPFFEAINKTFGHYHLTIKGENIIIENQMLLNKNSQN